MNEEKFSIESKLAQALVMAQKSPDGLARVTFKNHPGWVGITNQDGKGVALYQPTHEQVMKLRVRLAPLKYEFENRFPDDLRGNEQFLWGV